MTEFPKTRSGEQPNGDAVNTEPVNDAGVPADSAAAGSADFAGGMPPAPGGDLPPADLPAVDPAATVAPQQPADSVHPDTILAAERLNDLQRLNAEYVNYKRRVDRDRPHIQERAIQDVIEALLPVLDDIQGARDHGELTDGPFAAIADKLEATLVKFGAERYGTVGEAFDPEVHEALMHVDQTAFPGTIPEGATATTVVQVLQAGYRVGTRVLRPARVAVADPS